MSISKFVGNGYVPRTNNWTSIRLLNVYRMALATILFSQSFVSQSPLLKITDLKLYSWASFAFMVLSLVWMLAAWIERRGFKNQVSLQIYFDIVIIILLMHACGGISSGLGMLLIISVAVTSLLTEQSLAILFAALASLGLLAEHIYSTTNIATYSGSSAQVGILGASLVATAIVTHKLIIRLRSSEQLIQQRERDVALLSALNREIIANLQAGVIVLTRQNSIRHINQAAMELLRLDADKTISMQNDCPKLLNAVEAWRSSDSAESSRLQSVAGLDDIQISFRELGGPEQSNTLIFVNDVSSIRNSMQQAKLASLGHLTASIAHEVRNPLGAISYAAELLRENDQFGPADQRMIEIINQHTLRINNIIEDILKISRGDPVVKESIDLSVWLPNFVDKFCQSGVAETHSFETEFKLAAPAIQFDAGHLLQILTNLCTNAIVHGDDGQKILLRIFSNADFPICVEVADHGPGLKPEIIDKIFEPFYTTSHQGSGLGLYIVGQLCELNNASISARLNQFGGTSFTLQLLAADRQTSLAT